MTLQPLTQLIEVRDIRNVINANMTLVENAINGILGKLDTSNSSIKLVDAISSVPAGGIGTSKLIALNTVGTVIQIIKASGLSQTTTYTVDVDGNITCAKITASDDVVVGGIVKSTGQMQADGGAKITGTLDMTAAIIKHKYQSINIVSANTGVGATNPISLAGSTKVFLNYNNSGNALGNGGAVKLDTSQLVDGQVIELWCSGTNTSGMAFYNGTSGNEVFAFINPAGPGFTSISNTVLPTFNPSTSPNTQSWMKVMWMNIGSNVFRLVVLESTRVNGVS